MKRMMVGTAIGRFAMAARDALERSIAAFARPETAGTLANDSMAGFLTARLCRPGTTFLDIGAHIGSVVSSVAHHCPTATLVAVEAIPEKAAHLRRKFPAVEVHACALGDSEGQVSFFVNRRQSGFSSLQRPRGDDASHVTEITVPLRRLDDLITSTQVDLIKLDVEGAELGVLRGGERLVNRNRPVIMFESGPPSDGDLAGTKGAMWDWFAARNLCVLVPNRVAHDDPGLSRDGFLESHLYPRRTTNYFAVPCERRVEVRDRARVVLGFGS